MYAKHMPMPARKKLVDIVDVDVGPLNRMTAPAFAAAAAATQLGATGRRRKRAGAVKKSRNESLGSRIQLRCTAIQKFLLDHTQGSEKRIRETFGDNPDTSKALRMLVKLHRVKRFGSGGKSDPFVYMALIPPGMSELERLEEANAVGMI